jgi:hypothetical protein
MIPNLTKAKSAVLTVGKGRGFVIKSRGEHVVVTAAHCLPRLPPCHGMSYTKERTYSKLLSIDRGRNIFLLQVLSVTDEFFVGFSHVLFTSFPVLAGSSSDISKNLSRALLQSVYVNPFAPQSSEAG